MFHLLFPRHILQAFFAGKSNAVIEHKGKEDSQNITKKVRPHRGKVTNFSICTLKTRNKSLQYFCSTNYRKYFLHLSTHILHPTYCRYYTQNTQSDIVFYQLYASFLYLLFGVLIVIYIITAMFLFPIN